jgi:hypothetical protein
MAREYLVKVFFLPLMASFYSNSLQTFERLVRLAGGGVLYAGGTKQERQAKGWSSSVVALMVVLCAPQWVHSSTQQVLV